MVDVDVRSSHQGNAADHRVAGGPGCPGFPWFFSGEVGFLEKVGWGVCVFFSWGLIIDYPNLYDVLCGIVYNL